MSVLFHAYKKKILSDLEVSPANYSDKSPKGSVDANIVELINFINNNENYVTTSSCSGRISIFLEGEKSADGSSKKVASRGGGKGGGGRFLFVSHDPLLLEEPQEEETCGSIDQNSSLMEKFGLIRSSAIGETMKRPSRSTRFIHFKFEPMILHVLSASMQSALSLVAAGQEAGFRESGVVGTSPSSENNRISANIRASGLGFDSIIGYLEDQGAPLRNGSESITISYGSGGESSQKIAVVDELYLRLLVQTANERFKVNEERIKRFQMAIVRRNGYFEQPTPSAGQNETYAKRQDWEDAAARAERKRAEGLLKQASLQRSHDGKENRAFDAPEVNYLDILENS